MASGDELFRFGAWAQEPPASNAATPDIRNTTPVCDFPDTANFQWVASGHLSSKYTAGANINVVLTVAATSAVTGDSDWDAELETIGTAKDLDTDSFGTLTSTDNTTVPGTAGVPQKITITLTSGGLDSIAAGDFFRLRITNDAASDTRSGDMELIEVVLVEA